MEPTITRVHSVAHGEALVGAVVAHRGLGGTTMIRAPRDEVDDHARGGLTTETHALVDRTGRAVTVILSPDRR